MKQAAVSAGLAPIHPPGFGLVRFVRRHTVFLRDLFRYGLCSALALAVDWGILIGLVHSGLSPLAAAPIGFSIGMAVTYGLSITMVYADRRRAAPMREALVFLAIGVAGLCLNEVVLWLAITWFGLAAAIAKAPAAGLVFMFNFLLRRAALFSR